VGAVALLWLASLKLELWPEQLHLPRPELLWVAAAMHLPYALVRALRLGFVLDPLVQAASGDEKRRLSRRLLHGSGLVSFFVVILLPLRLGELSRPLLLSRGNAPGVGFPEAVGAVAVERVVDGLMVVGMLFLGLALTGPLAAGASADELNYVRWFGQLMAVAFAVGLVVLAVAGTAPQRAAKPARRIGSVVSPAFGEKLAGVVERVATSIEPLYELRRGVPFVLWTMAYWAITVLQLWLVLQACGLELSLAPAAAIVAIIGLSIQLPGGPAQAGSFQVGTALALGLFLPAGRIEAGGASFAAVMYLLQLVGAGVLALPGLGLLAWARRATAVSPDPPGR
jgi:hypothetical protein